VGYRVLGLLSGQPRLDRVRVVRPRVNLDALAEWNRRSFVRADSTHASSAGVGGPSFAIADLEIVDGALHSEAGLQVTGLHLEGSVGGRSGSWRIEVETAGTRIRTPRIDEQVELTGDVLVEDGIVRLQGLHFGAAGGRVSLKGHFDPSSREESVLQANGFAIPLEKVGAWVGVEHPLLFANLEFSLLAAGRPDSLRLSGEFDGKGEGGLDRSIHFSGTRTREKLRVETMHIETGPSIVDVQGELTLEEDPVIRGVAVFRQLDPSVLLADPELAGVRALDGAVRFDGVGITRDRFRGNAHLELSGGEVFGYRFDRASARINVDRGAVVLEEGTVQHGGSELTGQGSIGRDNLVTASLIGNIVDLNDFGGAALADVELSGQATLEMSVEGPLAGPAIDASLRFEESSVYGIRARTLDLKLSSERVGGGGEADVRITARELGYGERAIPQATAQGVLRGGAIVVQSLDLLSSRRGELHLSGELSLGAGGEVAGRVEVLEVRAPDGASAWTNDGFVTVERTENSLVVTGLNLRSEGGSIAGDISVAGNGESSVLATGTAVDLSLFSPYLLLPKALGGTLNFRADVLVGRERVEGDVAFELHDGQWGDDTLQRLEGNVTAADSVLSFHQVQLEASFATGNLEGDVAIPGGSFAGVLFDPPSRPALLDRMVFRNLHAELDSPDYDWFWDLLPNAPRVAGAGSFEADIDGPLLDPTARAHLDLTGGRLGTKPMDRLRVDGTYRGLDLTFMNGEIVSGDGVLTFDGTLPFQWNFQQPVPRIPSGRELDLHLMATDFPAGTLSSMLPLFEAVEGTAQADLQWKGADGSLHLLGEFSVDDASIRIPTIAEPLVDGHVEGLFDREGNVRLTVARFTDGAGGLVTGVGIVQLDNLKLVDYHLDVIGQNYHYVGLGLGIRGLGTGELAITGVEGKSGNVVPRFTGNVEVLRADLDERALTPPETALIGPQMPAGVSPPEETAPDAPSQPVERAEIYAEVALHGDRNIWLRTPEMDLEMAGDVTLHVTPEYAGLTGESRSLRGTYSVLNSRFNVERAEVEFIDPSQPMESYIDAEATTAVLDEDVTVLVSGTLANPVIELSTDSGMTEAEIYEMLALRIKRTDTGDVEGGVLDSAFRSSYLAAFTNRFGGELSRELGFDTFDFDAGSSDQGSSVTFGKRVGRDFFVKYRESVGSAQDETTLEATRESLESPERALTLEYRLSRIFTLQGETGTLKIGDEYLNVDLKLQWGY
jgi:autotransporter translocation and assembly factor TamB